MEHNGGHTQLVFVILFNSNSTGFTDTVLTVNCLQSQRLASMGDRDLVLGHADAIKWREARSWVKWLNKPQTRGQCKKVIKGHAAATQGASYICKGLVLLSVSADRTIKVHLHRKLIFSLLGLCPRGSRTDFSVSNH